MSTNTPLLTDSQCAEIAEKKDSGYTTRELTTLYHVSERTIRRAIQRGRPIQVKNPIKKEEPVETVTETTLEPIEKAPMSDDTENDVYTVILHNDSLVVTKNDESAIVRKDDERFASIVNRLLTEGTEEETLRDVYREISNKEAVMDLFKDYGIRITDVGTVYYKDQSFPPKLNNRLVEGAKSGDKDTLEKLLKFTDRVKINPSYTVVDELYDFLTAMDITIDDEGYVIAYKRVTNDYKDCHTGKIRNKVGDTPWMPRNEVDDNSKNTCSRGLHVASKPFFTSGMFRSGRLMKVRIDPADFVSIPEEYFEYNGGDLVKAKARVCQYTVIEEVADTTM